MSETTDIIKVPVSLPEPVVTDAAIEEAMKAVGYVDVSATKLKHFAMLGAALESAGTVKNQHGSAMVSQSVLHEGMMQLAEVRRKVSANLKNLKPTKGMIRNIIALNHEVVYTARALNEEHKTILKSEKSMPGGKPPVSTGPRNQTAPPRGQVIIEGGSQVVVNPPASPQALPEKGVANPA